MSVQYVTSDGFGARRARRGVTLAEGILYLTISFSVITFSAQTLVRERDKQEEALVAGDLRQFLASSQGYVSASYDSILADLYTGTLAGDPLALDIGLDDVVAAGYLPAVYVNNEGALGKVLGQDFTVLARGVRRSDTVTAAPGAAVPTVNRNDVEVPGGGAIDPMLTDRVFDLAAGNDELDLEILLVTTGGQPTTANRGNRIVAESRMPSAGFVRLVDENNPGAGIEAAGPYGAWTLNVTPFRDAGLLDESGPGYFAALVALSNFGSVSADPADITGKVDAEETLSRCSEVPAGSDEYRRCLGGNALFDSVVFNAWDSDGDGTPDQFPGLTGVGSIEMSQEAGATAGITGVRGIAMTGTDAAITGVTGLETGADGLTVSTTNPTAGGTPLPGTISGIGTLEMTDGRIDSLLGISCIAGGATSVTVDGILIDCPETSLSGTLATMGDAFFEGAVDIQGAAVIGGALNVAGETDLAGAVRVGSQTAATGSLTVSGTVAAREAEVAGLTVGGARADRVLMMTSEIVTLTGTKANVKKPDCGTGFVPGIVAMPISFVAASDKGSAYDRGTVVTTSDIQKMINEPKSGWPMERHTNETWPGQLVGVETRIDEKNSSWDVTLTVERRAWDDDKTTSTETNPKGATLMIQTLCRNKSAS